MNIPKKISNQKSGATLAEVPLIVFALGLFLGAIFTGTMAYRATLADAKVRSQKLEEAQELGISPEDFHVYQDAVILTKAHEVLVYEGLIEPSSDVNWFEIAIRSQDLANERGHVWSWRYQQITDAIPYIHKKPDGGFEAGPLLEVEE